MHLIRVREDLNARIDKTSVAQIHQSAQTIVFVFIHFMN
jgi:hypothetical protein